RYYVWFDQKPGYILGYASSLLYYKFEYIKVAWGGTEEQVNECAVGNQNAKNWQDEARKILKDTTPVSQDTNTMASNTNNRELNSALTEYDLYCQTLLLRVIDDGWQAELWHYLKDIITVVYTTCSAMLGWIVLDILPVPASSVPCEPLFSAAKEVEDDCH
ncbi:hypothetical protein L208DRAFT_1293488, partial [Tricholoma matsutake]